MCDWRSVTWNWTLENGETYWWQSAGPDWTVKPVEKKKKRIYRYTSLEYYTRSYTETVFFIRPSLCFYFYKRPVHLFRVKIDFELIVYLNDKYKSSEWNLRPLFVKKKEEGKKLIIRLFKTRAFIIAGRTRAFSSRYSCDKRPDEK